MAFLNFFLELLQTPAIILAIVALIGLIAQRKKFSDVLSGTVKTAWAIWSFLRAPACWSRKFPPLWACSSR